MVSLDAGKFKKTSLDSDQTQLLFYFSSVAGCPALFAKTVFRLGKMFLLY